MNNEQFFKLTQEIHETLKQEIEDKMIERGLDWSSIRRSQKQTGFPVAWFTLHEICHKPTAQLQHVTSATIFKLLAFFGYKLKSFIFTK